MHDVESLGDLLHSVNIAILICIKIIRTAEVSRPQRRAVYSLYTYHVLKLEDSVSFASGCATRTVDGERRMSPSRSRNRRRSPNMLTIYKVAGGSVALNSILPPRFATTFIARLCWFFKFIKLFFKFQCQTLERRTAIFSRATYIVWTSKFLETFIVL